MTTREGGRAPGSGWMGRRSALWGLGALLACSRTETSTRAAPSSVAPQAGSAPPAAPGAPAAVRLLTWDFDEGAGSRRAVVVVPAWGDPAARYPVLVALHGRGEAVKSPAEGALGWPRDYALTRAMERLHRPPLTSADLEGFVDAKRLARENAELAERPFGGLIVVCPHMSDRNPHSAELRPFERFVVNVLLPRVRAETPALAAPESTGIDGVSLGGAAALRIGLQHPEAFGAVGALQPALRDDQAGELGELTRAARARRPALRLRLLTSEDDYFREVIEETSRAWKKGGIAHDFDLVPGPHDYAFNRGPGSIEMLLWHDRALARG